MNKSTKKGIFALGVSALSYPLWYWLVPYLVQAKDYVPQGEDGTEMVTSLGNTFVLIILLCITFVASIILSQRIFKK